MRQWKIGWMSCALALTAGCASVPERKAFEAVEKEESEERLTPARVPVPSRLPSITDASLLDDYLAYGALNNPELEAAFNRWKAALEAVPQARSLPDPKFNYGYFIREVETRVGPQQQRLGLAQMFPWFGKLELQGAVAMEEAEAARLRYESAKLKLFFQIKEAYYELYYLRQAIGITEDNIQLIKHLESVAQSRFKSGAPVTGVVKAQVELSKLSDRLLTLNEMRDPIAAKLNASLNRAPDAPLPWPESADVTMAAIDVGRWAAWMKENPELKSLEALVRKEDKAMALARKAYYPDLTLGVDYIQTGDALNAATPDDGKDAVIAQFSVNIPLWTGKYRAGVAEARARGDAARQTRKNRENLLMADVRMALYRFRDAERKIDLYRNTLVPQARGALEVAQSSYESGQTDFLNLIDAQRLLLQFELEAERAVADREQQLAEIEMLVGRELPRLGTEGEQTP